MRPSSTETSLDALRAGLVQRYQRNRTRTREIFSLLSDAAFYEQPISLRHPIVFYVGHLPGFTFNTLVNNERNYFQTGRTNGLGATDTVFANNVLQGGGAAASLSGPYTGGVWSGNIIWQTAGPGVMPPGTYDEVDPLLVAKANGLFRPQTGSPAIDTAVGDFPAVDVDMDGQPRQNPKDRGADEISDAPMAGKFLTPGDLLGMIHQR